MKKLYLSLIALAIVSFLAGATGKDHDDNTWDNTVKAEGTVTRGDKTGKLTAGEWGNDHMNITLHDQTMQTEVNLNAADVFETFEYTISTMSDEHLLDGGKAWGTVVLPGEGSSTLLSGILKVKIEDDVYTIELDGKDRDGNVVKVKWVGTLVKSPYAY